jgi:hypothetical protein
MKTTNYNGYTNYETWAVSLWIDNEEGSHRYWRERASEALEAAQIPHYMRNLTWTKEDQAKRDLADALKDQFEEGEQELLKRSDAQSSVWADLLGAALSEVNWFEIAGNMIDCAKEQAVS